MSKIKISPSSAIWFIFLLFSTPTLALPLISAVALHELGHLFCAKLLGVKIYSFNLSVLGARLNIDSEISYTDELLISIFGPLFGMLGFGFTFFVALKYTCEPFCDKFLFPFSCISLCLAVFNLAPIDTLDGGRIAKCLCYKLFALSKAEKIIKYITFCTLAILWLIATYLMIKIADGLSMFVFCAILFSKCFIFNSKNRDFKSF